MSYNGTGFPGVTGDEALSVTTSRPNTPQVVDEYGSRMVVGTTDNLNPDADFPIDTRIREFAQFGVLNGDFARPPADPYHDISDINPLPDWTGPVTVAGGSITAQWVESSSNPSGYGLQFTIPAGGSSDDEVYFEQIIPIGGDRSRINGHLVRAIVTFSTALAGMTLTVKGQYLDADGATVGSSYDNSIDDNSGTTPVVLTDLLTSAVPGATARSLRIRLHALRAPSAVTGVGTIVVSSVRVEHAVGALIVGDQANASGPYFPTDITQVSGLFQLRTGYDAGHHILYFDAANQVVVLNDYGGITFPATQIPIADANTLDDYEEDTFTPALAYATVGTSSWATTTATGTYTKIGNAVFFHYTYQGVPTNGTGAGNLTLSGLPFTSSSSAPATRYAVGFQGYTKANYTWITGVVAQNAATGTFDANGSGQARAALAVGDIPSGGTVLVVGGGYYQV